MLPDVTYKSAWWSLDNKDVKKVSVFDRTDASGAPVKNKLIWQVFGDFATRLLLSIEIKIYLKVNFLIYIYK